MTDKEKAKAYDKALEKARAMYGGIPTDNAMLEEIFPVLQRNDDYKILRLLEWYIKKDIDICESISTGLSKHQRKKILAYIEKQKESLYIPETSKENANSFSDEGERIRKWLYDFIHNCPNETFEFYGGVGKQAVLAYLEKQKDLDKMIVVSPEVWDNAISDAYENGKGDSEKQKEQKPWKVGANAYFTPEQKPAEYLDKDRIYAIMKKLHNLSFSQDILINSKEYKQIDEITHDVRDLLDYPIEQKPTEWSEEDKEALDMCLDAIPKAWKTKSGILLTKWLKDNIHLQPKQEWSDEDKKLLDFWLDVIDRNDWRMDENFCKASREFINRIKSLHPLPHWKPSEEQMKQLHYALTPGSAFDCDILNEFYRQLKKLM